MEMHPELGREVPVGSIEKELKKLWAEDEARTKASLMNLAVYSEKPGALVRNSEAVRRITQDHACRAILIGIDREATEASIRAWITAHCHLSNGRKSVCSEQVAFALTGKATGRLRNTVFANLASDLPLIFWWQGELSPIFEDRLYSLVDRFVFDSSEWEDPLASFQIVMGAVKQATRELVIQDLAWTRTFQFRVSVASLFDDPVALAALGEVERVVIGYHPAHRVSAMQMLAWLKVQAGWSGSERVERGFRLEGRVGRAIEVEMVEDAAGAALGRVELVAGDVRVVVTREKDATHVGRRIESSLGEVSSLGPADPVDAVLLVAEQLSRGGKNSLFSKVVPTFLEFLQKF